MWQHTLSKSGHSTRPNTKSASLASAMLKSQHILCSLAKAWTSRANGKRRGGTRTSSTWRKASSKNIGVFQYHCSHRSTVWPISSWRKRSKISRTFWLRGAIFLTDSWRGWQSTSSSLVLQNFKSFLVTWFPKCQNQTIMQVFSRTTRPLI